MKLAALVAKIKKPKALIILFFLVIACAVAVFIWIKNPVSKNNTNITPIGLPTDQQTADGQLKYAQQAITKKQYQEAISACELASTKLVAAGKPKTAETSLQACINKLPPDQTDDLLYAYLADAASQAGDKQLAKQSWQTALTKAQQEHRPAAIISIYQQKIKDLGS